MNVIFLTIVRMADINSKGIYTDLMRKFRDEGHNVYIVCSNERRYHLHTETSIVDGVNILEVKTLNIQKCNVVEKGIGTILLESQFKKAIKKFFRGITFDLILYSTPPITFNNVIKYLKKKNNKSISYLLLKDIFPQNAVDLEYFSTYSIFYKFFRKKEILLYQNSDYIGCMSPANVEYLLNHNKFIDKNNIEVAPNSIELQESKLVNKDEIRTKYNLPIDKPVFIYGGNLGKPQGIEFLIKCLDSVKNRNDCYFVIVGSGTEEEKLLKWHYNNIDANVLVLKALPKGEYDILVQSCDVGLIFLDYRFTIPNYPSRLLSYLEYKMPIISVTDINTDIGRIAEDNNYGFSCTNNNVEEFVECVDRYVKNKNLIIDYGANAYNFLCRNYLVTNTYNKIISHL